MKYFLVIDQSTQWFSRLVVTFDEKETQWKEVPSEMRGDFLNSIYQREMWPQPIEMSGQSWGGWNIGLTEYVRIKRMIELWPAVQEYQKLQDYNV